MSGLDEQNVMNDCPRCGHKSDGFWVGINTFMYSPNVMKKRNLKYSLFIKSYAFQFHPVYSNDFIKCQSCHTKFYNGEEFYRHTKMVFEYVVESGKYYKTSDAFRRDAR